MNIRRIAGAIQLPRITMRLMPPFGRRTNPTMLRTFSTEKPPKGFGNFSEKNTEKPKKPLPDDAAKSEPKVEKDTRGTENPDATTEKSSEKKEAPRFQVYKINFNLNQNWLFFVIPVLYILAQLFFSNNSKEITWNDFRTSMLDKGLVDYLKVVSNSFVKIYLRTDSVGSPHEGPSSYYFTIGSVENFERKLESAQDELRIPSRERIAVTYTTEIDKFNLFMNFFPLILLGGLLLWSSGGFKGMKGGSGPGGIFNVGKSKAKLFNQETDVKVKFKDVAGMDEAKLEIMEFVKFLKHPEQYERLGAKIPKGAVLSGPPGTGKTLLAKATAGEAGVPFFSVSGSEFVEMFVGVGSSRVRDLFSNAKKHAPCIIFVDEIDAIGKKRSKGGNMGGNDERESTLNQLLVEMDGFGSNEHVVVLAGTNRPDVLDPALLRPGRFDRHINIDLPDIKGDSLVMFLGRVDIFKVHLQPIKIVETQNVDDLSRRLAALTPGFSGADIANVCNEAALMAARYLADSVNLQNFEGAIERVIGGLERKSNILTPNEKKIVAHHEAGHAVAGWFLEHANPLLKVSIIPRGKALGYAQYLPQELKLHSSEQILDTMCMTLGGRVSEEIFFNSVTTGAQDDLQKVTRAAYDQVSSYGMTTALGNISYPRADGGEFQKPFSEATANLIDEEARRLIKVAYDRTYKLLTDRKEEVKKLAELLIKKEVAGREDMIELFGERPFGEPGLYLEYLSISKESKAPEAEKAVGSE